MRNCHKIQGLEAPKCETVTKLATLCNTQKSDLIWGLAGGDLPVGQPAGLAGPEDSCRGLVEGSCRKLEGFGGSKV